MRQPDAQTASLNPFHFTLRKNHRVLQSLSFLFFCNARSVAYRTAMPQEAREVQYFPFLRNGNSKIKMALALHLNSRHKLKSILFTEIWCSLFPL